MTYQQTKVVNWVKLDRKPWQIIEDALEEYVVRHYGKEHKRKYASLQRPVLVTGLQGLPFIKTELARFQPKMANQCLC